MARLICAPSVRDRSRLRRLSPSSTPTSPTEIRGSVRRDAGLRRQRDRLALEAGCAPSDDRRSYAILRSVVLDRVLERLRFTVTLQPPASTDSRGQWGTVRPD